MRPRAVYASVGSVDPFTARKTLAVGGGVVSARLMSEGLRGARGMPGRRARELCPELIFVGGHFKDYQRLGDAAIKVLGDFTPLVERISIDEAFADVAGCTHLFGPPVDIAKAIRARVRDELGLPISIGVARTKHLAKIGLAGGEARRAVFRRSRSELEFLHDLPVEMVGLSARPRKRDGREGVITIGQLARRRRRARCSGCSATRSGKSFRRAAVESRSRDIRTHRRAHSAGAQLALGKKASDGHVVRPTLLISPTGSQPSPGEIRSGRT